MATKTGILGGMGVVVTRVGGLWILAGALFKLFLGSPADLPEIVKSLPLDLGLTFRVAIAAELSIALLALLKPRAAWLLLMVLLVLFDIALVTQIRAGEASCGCFGSKIVVPPEVVLAIDSLLLLLILVSRPWASMGRDAVHAMALIVLLAIAISLPWILDREAKGAQEGGVAGLPAWHRLEAAAWVGRPVDETDLATWADLSGVPDEGLWILYRDSCEMCAELFEWLILVEMGQRPIVLVHLPENEGEVAEPVVKELPTGEFVHRVGLPDGVDWVFTTPGGLVLRDRCVLWAKESMSTEDYRATEDPEPPPGCE